MSDSRRCSSADSENMRDKNYKNLSAALAPIQFQAMLIYHFELHILPKVSKTVGILAKTHKNLF
jgi:hypothetical protein